MEAYTCRFPYRTSSPILPGTSMAVVCGSTASAACNGNPVLESDPNELHEVRCCSYTNLGGGWMKKSGCNVWGESDPAGVCNSEKTFDEAFEICNAVGARLCTKEELLADCTRGTGKFIQIVHFVSPLQAII